MTGARWLLLHGTPLSPEVWNDVRAHLTGETAAPDLTELIPAAGPAQEQVAAAVLAGLPGGDLVLVGHSFGGQVAIDVALQAPDRVRRLIIVCSRHIPFPPFADGARRVRAGDPFDIEAGLRRWFTPAELAADPPVVGYLRRRLTSAPRGPWAASLDATACYDRSAAVRRIGVPARLFGARCDPVATPAVMAALAGALPDARLRIVDEWAHMSPFADPGGFAATLQEAAD